MDTRQAGGQADFTGGGHQPPQTLTLIGYWDGPHTSPGWPDVSTFIDDSWDPDERDDVLHYLRHGIVVAAMMGYSSCRLCGTRNGNLELSDGVFVWPEGLWHYVAEHAVRRPDAFVTHTGVWTEAFEAARRSLETEWWRSVTPGSDSGQAQ